MLNKDEVLKRALLHHSPTGRVVTALNKIFATVYPSGTNLVLMFVQEFIGLPYGHVDMCMDKVVDCAELWRITFYIWFGIDIGSFSDAEYRSKLGVLITTDFDRLSTCRPLDLVFYDVSDTDSKITGHVSGIFDALRIFQSGAASNGSLVNFSPINWLPRGRTKGCFKGAKRYLMDEQYNSVIVPIPVTPPAPPVEPAKPKTYEYAGATYINLRSEANTKSKALAKVKHGREVEFVREVKVGNDIWWLVRFGTLSGYCAKVVKKKVYKFKEV